MSSIVIVTNQCYLLCDAINYIAIREIYEDQEEDDRLILNRRKRKRKLTQKQKMMQKLKKETQLYEISIDFVSTNNGNAQSNSRHGGPDNSLTIVVRGYDNCLTLYKDMVDQIREQLPDKVFLDKLVDRFLDGKEESL